MSTLHQSTADETNENFLGPRVLVVRHLHDGRIENEWMPAALAVEDVLYNPRNGGEVARAHVEWFDVLDDWSFSP